MCGIMTCWDLICPKPDKIFPLILMPGLEHIALPLFMGNIITLPLMAAV